MCLCVCFIFQKQQIGSFILRKEESTPDYTLQYASGSIGSGQIGPLVFSAKKTTKNFKKNI